jgi:hypothetical protein
MKTLSRILITVLVVLGVTFVVMLSFSSCQQHKENYAGGKAGCGAIEVKFGMEENGCKPVVPFPDPTPCEKCLTAAGVSKECYKIKFSDPFTGASQGEIGGLAKIECHGKTGAQFRGPRTHAPSGSGGTQRVMFNTEEMKNAFEKCIKK